MKVFVTIITLFLLGLSTVFGQISQDLEPVSSSVNQLKKLTYLNLEQEGSRNQEIVESEFPLYAGFTLPFNDKELKKGVWEETNNGWTIWRLALNVENASAVNIYFKDLNLEIDERLFVYNPSKKNLLGAFTELNNDKHIGTAFLSGDSLIIEFNTTKNTRILPFSISEIGVSDSPLETNKRNFGNAGSCEVLVNCPEGDDLQNEKRGVARILVKEGSSLFWCSGSLVNNTNRDGKPYLLTAHHCGEDSSEEDLSEWLFFFNYESVDCEFPALEPQYQSVSGASLIADGKKTSSGSDFRLLLLEEEIPANYKPYFNGWSRSVSPSPHGTGIHHPEGDLKMISSYSSALVSTSYNNPEPDEDGRFWRVNWSETESGHGVTEGGSSGSPIFSPDGYIVGTLSGGRASCGQLTQPDYYGKFDVHWDGNGVDSTDQLKPWLDPTDSDVPALSGLDLDTTNISADFSSDKTMVSVGGGIQFKSNSTGDINSYTWEFSGGEPEFAESETPPKIYYYKTGEFNVKLRVKSATDTDSLTIVNYVRVVPNFYPNPSADGRYNIFFGEKIPDDLEIEVYSIDGHTIEYKFDYAEENLVKVDLSKHPQGIYLIQLTTEGKRQIIKVGNKIASYTN